MKKLLFSALIFIGALSYGQDNKEPWLYLATISEGSEMNSTLEVYARKQVKEYFGFKESDLTGSIDNAGCYILVHFVEMQLQNGDGTYRQESAISCVGIFSINNTLRPIKSFRIGLATSRWNSEFRKNIIENVVTGMYNQIF